MKSYYTTPVFIESRGPDYIFSAH